MPDIPTSPTDPIPYGRTVASRQQKRLSEERRRNEHKARVHRISGKFMMNGVGEATQDVNFPVKFFERPNLTFGGELSPDAVLTDGSFPTVSVVVVRWNIEEPEVTTTDSTPERRYYVGATLAVVTTGHSSNSMWVHWTMEGKAIVNPVAGLNGFTTDSTI